MVYDFGLLKGHIRDLIDSFDHAICFWNQDDAGYIDACKQYSARWISLPVSPSAEQFSRIFFFLADTILRQTITQNGEGDVVVHSVIVHETATGYAQCFRADVVNAQMGVLTLPEFEFSEQVQIEWADPQMYEKIKQGIPFENPQVEHAVKVSPRVDV
jgi:6-pyruvoyltetrahydropterin/6-carboxytetrahydropterin synthase